MLYFILADGGILQENAKQPHCQVDRLTNKKI